MEIFKIEHFCFTYPNSPVKALNDISFEVKQGEFIAVFGKSGCGKSTLLHNLKPSVARTGTKDGRIFFKHKDISSFDEYDLCSEIGFVMQNPDNQIVTDKVWHELAFGLENMGMKNDEIRARISETASFFGIHNWFYKDVSELSGGQKQILNLASVMIMQPSVLILDEPTSQLDPIARDEFFSLLNKINKELGTAVIISEHNLDEVFPLSDKVIAMENSKIIAYGTPSDAVKILHNSDNDMIHSLPSPSRIYCGIENNMQCPVTIREGRDWIFNIAKERKIEFTPKVYSNYSNARTAIEMKDVYFRYEKNSTDIIKGLSLKIYEGEIYSIMGGNGTGKSTALSIISGLLSPYSGKVSFFGKNINKIKSENIYGNLLGVLPQNTRALFAKNTVYHDLEEMLDNSMKPEEKGNKIHTIANICGIEHLMNTHPYDLSGGEQQRAALAKILLSNPSILLLDEPTNGMDGYFKKIFADILLKLKKAGKTIVVISHDMEFCAGISDRCAMFFDGAVTSEGNPTEFFSGKNFYTTAANRMVRDIIPKAVLTDEVISALGGKIKNIKNPVIPAKFETENMTVTAKQEKQKNTALSFAKISVIVFFFMISILSVSIQLVHKSSSVLLEIISLISFVLGCSLIRKPKQRANIPVKKRNISRRTILSAVSVFILIPLTIFAGIFILKDRKYYFISLMIILEIMFPFFINFESTQKQAKEIITIASMSAIGAAGRVIFYMIPQFKPMSAVIIMSGAVFGAESGFMVGVLSAFISNIFFGQGTWTPWQMFSSGIIGFIAGILCEKGLLKKEKLPLCIYGFLSVMIIYGGVMNFSGLFYIDNLNFNIILSTYITALPFDIIHALSTAFFLWTLSEPMIEKTERIKIKYGF